MAPVCLDAIQNVDAELERGSVTLEALYFFFIYLFTFYMYLPPTPLRRKAF